jgi:hypothetical protein
MKILYEILNLVVLFEKNLMHYALNSEYVVLFLVPESLNKIVPRFPYVS